MQGYLACGFIASVGSITKRASLYSILLAASISSFQGSSGNQATVLSPSA